MPHETAALTRAWPIICHLIALAQLRLANVSVSGERRWSLNSITRLAESLVRRWLVLSAHQAETWPSVREAVPSQTGVITPAAKAARPHPDPRFRLAEPLPALAAWMFAPPSESLGAVQATDPIFNPARLRARISALCAVITAPEPHIKRMARWLTRAAARRSTEPCRLTPLGIGWPAGTSRAAKRRDPEWVSMALYLDLLAHEAVRRGGSP